MLTFAVPLFSIGEILRRIAHILRIDAGEVARSGVRVIGVWLLAFLAYRILGLLARRIEQSVDDGDESTTTTRERRGRPSPSCCEAWAGSSSWPSPFS